MTNRLVAIFAVTLALLTFGPTTLTHAAAASSAGDAVSIGDPDALGQIDLYVDRLCPYSGKMVRAKGDEIGQRIENGTLHVSLRFVDFLDKYSASGTYDDRAIYSTYVGPTSRSPVTSRGASCSRSTRSISSRRRRVPRT